MQGAQPCLIAAYQLLVALLHCCRRPNAHSAGKLGASSLVEDMRRGSHKGSVAVGTAMRQLHGAAGGSSGSSEWRAAVLCCCLAAPQVHHCTCCISAASVLCALLLAWLLGLIGLLQQLLTGCLLPAPLVQSLA